MKPRLESARDTQEDADIWLFLLMRAPKVHAPGGPYLRFTLWSEYRNSDQRDANLMLVLGWWREQHFARRWRYAAEAAEFPGMATDDKWWPGNWHDITNYA